MLLRNSTICASKSEAVCREIQTHFESSLPASFTEKVVSAIPQFMRPKMKRFAVKFRRFLEILCPQVLKKRFWTQFHELWSKNEAVCREIQTHSGSSLPARFTEKFLEKFSRFMCPKMKLFAVKFRPILQVFRLQD